MIQFAILSPKQQKLPFQSSNNACESGFTSSSKPPVKSVAATESHSSA